MVPILHPLPLDWTGDAATNIVLDEVHDLTDQSGDPYKIVVLEKGYFYTHDLIVSDHLHKSLIKDVDYQLTVIQPEVAKKTAFKACAVIVITNPRINKKVFVTARMVGGEYCMLTDGIISMAQSLLAGGKRKVYYRNLTNKPSDFTPSGHQHAWWQLYGFTEPTSILQRIRTAQKIITGRDFLSLYSEWRLTYDNINNQLTAVEASLTAHIADTEDPHQVTKVQVQLERVYNATLATYGEAIQQNGSAMFSYATPLRVKESIQSSFLPTLQQHIANTNNPHGVTYATLGTLSVQELQQKANNYYDRGSATNASYRLSGITWDQVKANIRSSIPAANITTGRFNWPLYSANPPPADHILSGADSGYLTWIPIRNVMSTYIKQGNKIFYLAGNFTYDGQVVNNAFKANFGPQPAGSIGIFRWTRYHGTGTSNGGILVPLTNLSVLRSDGVNWWL